MAARTRVLALAASAAAAFAFLISAPLPGSSGAVRAAETQPVRPGWASLNCLAGQRYAVVQHGIDDTFSQVPSDPPPVPGPLYTVEGANILDSTAVNYHFSDTLPFTLLPGETLAAARFTTRMKANGDFWENDMISLYAGTTPLGSSYVPTSTGLSSYDITPNGVQPNQPPGPGPGTGGGIGGGVDDSGGTVIGRLASSQPMMPASDVLSQLATASHLDIYVEDDTSVDFTGLELCINQPQPSYDIGVQKIHDGHFYQIRVKNYGMPIQPPAKIEVTEMVPAGLTMTLTTVPPGWTCTPTTVTGPDVITCTYLVTGTIATNASLPPITLASKGEARCQNCVRARLYVQGPPPWPPTRPNERAALNGPPGPPPFPWLQVHESNMDNNVSCVN